MTIKEISEVFLIIRNTNKEYILYTKNDNRDEFYQDYHGSFNNPFIGCVEKNGNIFEFISYNIDLEILNRTKFKTMDELKSLVKDYIYYIQSMNLNTDCCNPTVTNSYKCECAFYQFFKNNTNYEYDTKTNSVKFKGITINAHANTGDDHSIILISHFENEKFTTKKCNTPLDVINYLKSFTEMYLYQDIADSISNIERMSNVDINADYTFDDDILCELDWKTLNVQVLGALKSDLIAKLEEKLNLLKNS